jgi:hypothetical protein
MAFQSFHFFHFLGADLFHHFHVNNKDSKLLKLCYVLLEHILKKLPAHWMFGQSGSPCQPILNGGPTSENDEIRNSDFN